MAEEIASIYSVLSSPALKEAFKWHSISLYCPENLMFVDKVDQTWRGLFLKEVSAADTVLVAKSLFQTFFSEEAQWEVSITAAEKNRLKALISAPPPSGFDASLFDKAYDMVVRDMSRSLANFQTTDLWRVFSENATVVEEIFLSTRPSTLRRGRSASMDLLSRSRSSSLSSNKTPRERTPRDRSESVDSPSSETTDGSESIEYDTLSKAEILARVRALYRTTQPVKLVKQLNRDIYSCMVGNEMRGVARAEGETFYFCDLQSKILMNVPIAILFGKSDVEVRTAQDLETTKSDKTKLFRRKSTPVIASVSKDSPKVEKPKAEKLEASKPEPAKAEPETSRLRRSNTTNGLRRQNSVSVLGKGRRSSSAALRRVVPPEKLTVHFKTVTGDVVGPVSLLDARVLWKYHLLDSSTEFSHDTGLSWAKISEAGTDFGLTPENQIKSIDPTIIVKNF